MRFGGGPPGIWLGRVPNNQFWHRQRPELYFDAIGKLSGLACLPAQPATPFTRGVFT
jgi:hypothetical protein